MKIYAFTDGSATFLETDPKIFPTVFKIPPNDPMSSTIYSVSSPPQIELILAYNVVFS